MSEPGKQESTVKFAFEKSPSYRTVHADGAWAAVDSWSNVRIAFYNERPPLPVSGVLKLIDQKGWVVVPDGIKLSSDAPLIREVDVDVTMSLEVAKQVHGLLGRFIEMATEQLNNAQNQTKV